MATSDPDREERRRAQKEIADSLKESGALDEIFARIDAGEPLTGQAGLLQGMLKASLERGLHAELSDQVGYGWGDLGLTRVPGRSDHGAMRFRLALVALGLVTWSVVGLAGTPAGAALAGAPAMTATATGQEPDAPADDGTGASAEDDVEPAPGDDIIPEPNSGRAPTEAGDRGGALQILLFVALVAGVGGIAAMIVRESRRNRAAGLGRHP